MPEGQGDGMSFSRSLAAGAETQRQKNAWPVFSPRKRCPGVSLSHYGRKANTSFMLMRAVISGDQDQAFSSPPTYTSEFQFQEDHIPVTDSTHDPCLPAHRCGFTVCPHTHVRECGWFSVCP